jgi:hypothetical protein
MPDDVAVEKVKALNALGADVLQVRPASIVDKKQFVVRLQLVVNDCADFSPLLSW